MGYLAYLTELLRPLGVYDLTEHSFGGASLAALGAALDALQARLDENLRESLTDTAQDLGLSRYEALLGRYTAGTAAQRRAAVAGLLRVGGVSLTELNGVLADCVTPAMATETGQPGVVQVSFPGTMGVPPGLAALQRTIRDVLPCHLELRYFYRYLYWSDTAALGLTWADLSGLTWAQTEVYDIYG